MTSLRWPAAAFVYFLILVFGLITIEARAWANNPGRGFVARVPLLVAAYNWIFRPERMQYIAVTDLKANHKIGPGDLTQLDKFFCDYLPSLKDIEGKYLKSAVAAGGPVLLENLSEAPTVEPRSDSWIVSVRLKLDPDAEKLMQPDLDVAVIPKNSAQLQGTIVNRSADPALTKTAEGDKKASGTKADQSPSPRPELLPKN
jgi:hypothetical protein